MTISCFTTRLRHRHELVEKSQILLDYILSLVQEDSLGAASTPVLTIMVSETIVKLERVDEPSPARPALTPISVSVKLERQEVQAESSTSNRRRVSSSNLKYLADGSLQDISLFRLVLRQSLMT